MARTVDVSVTRSEVVHALPGAWTTDELRRLLELVEFDDIDGLADSDFLDMTLMVLQDLDHQQAGEHVLEAVFGNEMSAGVRQNLVDDLQDDEPWQDFSNVQQQRGIFVTVVLMHQAFPNRYPNPDAVKLEVSVEPPPGALGKAALLRLLAAGMAETDVLRRLYEADLERGEFRDADAIIWHREEPDLNRLVLISSRQWLGSLTRGLRFRATLA